MASRGPVEIGQGVVHGLVIAQVDPAQRVDHILQSVELDLRDVVDLLAGDGLDLLDERLLAGQLRDGVDLHIGAVHLHQRIARDGDERAGAGIGLGQHEDRVSAEPGDRLRLFAGALVGSEDEPAGA